MNYSLLYSIVLLLPFQLLCMNDQEFDKMLSNFKKFGQDTGFSPQQPAPIITALEQSNAPAEQPLAAQSQEPTIPPHLISVFSLAGSEKKSAGKKFKCQYGCDTELSRSALRRHYQRTHAHQAPFKCSRCEKLFFNKNGMAQHYLLVHGEQFKDNGHTES